VERDYRGQFRGLSGSGIPLGNYEARIACGDDRELTQTINLKNGSQLELVAFSGRLMRSEPSGPELVVKLANVPSGNEIWWLRLNALYGQESYIARFGVASGEARLVDPEPGVYLVSVHSTSGYGCVSEVHFVEFTRRWIFHAEACSFEFDRYAELIQRDASHRPVPSQWSEEMQRYKLEFLRALEKAAERQ